MGFPHLSESHLSDLLPYKRAQLQSFPTHLLRQLLEVLLLGEGPQREPGDVGEARVDADEGAAERLGVQLQAHLPPARTCRMERKKMPSLKLLHSESIMPHTQLEVLVRMLQLTICPNYVFFKATKT